MKLTSLAVSKEIIGILSEHYKAPSPRTLNYWIKRFKAVGPEELKLEQSIQWNLMGEYGIPWESTSLLIGLSNRGFPTIRRAQWWWRVSLARPDFSYSEILKINFKNLINLLIYNSYNFTYYILYKMNNLILVRHGQSQWNLENRFTGWIDVSLTQTGNDEAIFSGNTLVENKFKIIDGYGDIEEITKRLYSQIDEFI